MQFCNILDKIFYNIAIFRIRIPGFLLWVHINISECSIKFCNKTCIKFTQMCLIYLRIFTRCFKRMVFDRLSFASLVSLRTKEDKKKDG